MFLSAGRSVREGWQAPALKSISLSKHSGAENVSAGNFRRPVLAHRQETFIRLGAPAPGVEGGVEAETGAKVLRESVLNNSLLMLVVYEDCLKNS